MEDNERKPLKYSRGSKDNHSRRGGGQVRREQIPKTPSRHRFSHTVREERHVEPKPMPLGAMCNPVCPLFRCAKKVLMVKLISGKPTAFCVWVNDVCISHKCQYASCSQRHLLPDGKCAAVIRGSTRKEDAFIKELEQQEDVTVLKNLLSRKGFGKDLIY